jgi:hypothetical protein
VFSLFTEHYTWIHHRKVATGSDVHPIKVHTSTSRPTTEPSHWHLTQKGLIWRLIPPLLSYPTSRAINLSRMIRNDEFDFSLHLSVKETTHLPSPSLPWKLIYSTPEYLSLP